MPNMYDRNVMIEALTNELTLGSSLASERIIINPMVSCLDNRVEDAKVKRCPDTCGLPVLRSMISAWLQMVRTLDEILSWEDELGGQSCRWYPAASLPPASRH